MQIGMIQMEQDSEKRKSRVITEDNEVMYILLVCKKRVVVAEKFMREN